MRCLQCGKELALLKRLTGAAEFCSDAHRKQYQDDFNNLALKRLLQNQAEPPPPPKPLPLPELPPPIEEPPAPVAAPQPEPVKRAVKAGPKVPPKPAAKPAEAEKPPAKMASYLVEAPQLRHVQPAIVGIDVEPLSLHPSLPERALQATASAWDRSLPFADPVSLRPHSSQAFVIHPREGALDIREFSRKAAPPALQSRQQFQSKGIALSSAVGETMEITYQPHPPSGPPVLWQAGPLPESGIEPVLGELGRLEFGIEGVEELPRSALASVTAPPVLTPVPPSRPSLRTVEPVATAPLAAPVAESTPAAPTREPAPVAPPAATEPVPVTLHGVAAAPARPVARVSDGIRVPVPSQAPSSTALPLRPTMILAPKPVTEPTQPKPAAAHPLPAQEPSRPARVSSAKTKRPEVRIVQTTAPKQPVAAPVPSPAPAAQAKPAAPAPPPPAPKASPAPAPKHASPKPTLVSPEPRREPEPQIDLHLPELHAVEVSGPWARLPGAVRAGVGAAVALGIIGFAYSAFNSNNAAATPAAVVPSYQLGKQINSGGWIEDWAPADNLRRVTLLRGSQPFSDYRMEFEAQILNKAVGWMYRGLNPKNYYVAKLEKLKGGLEPVVALVRYAVIDGKNEGRVETVLPMKVRVDTTYRIRFDAVGPEFSLWVQDKKIETWRDTRLGSGGLGLYSEGDETADIHGTVNVFELVSTR